MDGPLIIFAGPITLEPEGEEGAGEGEETLALETTHNTAALFCNGTVVIYQEHFLQSVEESKRHVYH